MPTKAEVAKPMQMEGGQPRSSAVPHARSGGVNGGRATGLPSEAVSTTAAAFQKKLDGVAEKIQAGHLSVELEPAQVKESVGSDRVGEWEKGEAFDLLRENIRERGQTQPIRVRPADPRWKPEAHDPTNIPSSVEFYVQSGRRRLAACRELGIKVLAIVATDTGILRDHGSTEDEKAALSDLEERFAENTIRQDLSALERMLSIGQLAHRLKNEEHLKQHGISARLGVDQSEVSQSLKLWRDWTSDGESRRWFNGDVSKRVLRDFIPHLGKGLDTAEVLTDIAARGRGSPQDDLQDTQQDATTQTPARPAAAKPKVKSRKHSLSNGSSFAVARASDGIKVTAKALTIAEERQGDFEKELADLLERYLEA